MSDSITAGPALRRAIRQRAARELSRRQVCVDYYRIDQKLYYPIPVRAFPEKASRVAGLPDYPYAIWLLWALEERILALGWKAHFDGDVSAAKAAALDLRALGGWQRFREVARPDLCVAHCSRLLRAAAHWNWPDKSLKRHMRDALRRLTDDSLAILEPLGAETVEALLASDTSLANIPVIGMLGLSLAARACRHPQADMLWQRAALMAEAWLENGCAGNIEGVCYDGYTADFLMDWLVQAPARTRQRLLAHPRLAWTLDEIACLGSPQRPENIALIGDVEPFQMRFHYSFAVKYSALGGTGPAGGIPWPRNPYEFLRCDALPVYATLRLPRRKAPQRGMADAHYAIALNDPQNALKTVVSWSHSNMGHMQPDAGSVVIARGADWLITDPGYRQYMPTPEKTFTLGPLAHNQPIINGYAAQNRLVDRDYVTRETDTALQVEFDLSSLYPPGASVKHAKRTVSSSASGVRIHDVLQAKNIRQVEYCWHGHPDGYWRIEGGKASIILDGPGLGIECCGHEILPDELCSLPGARGHLSLHKIIRWRGPRQQVEVIWNFSPMP